MALPEFLKANDAVRYKKELGTNPRVYYILGTDRTSEVKDEPCN